MLCTKANLTHLSCLEATQEQETRMSKQMVGAEDVAKALNTSKGYAYKVIRKLNEEMEEKGMLVVKDKVGADYFAERYFGKDGGGDVR